MTYHFSKIVSLPFDEAVNAATESLKRQGFGVLTQIDVRETLHKKLDVAFRPYLYSRRVQSGVGASGVAA